MAQGDSIKALPMRPEIDKRIEEGWSYRQIERWLKEEHDVRVTHVTIAGYARQYKEHLERMVEDEVKRLEEEQVITKVSAEAFLRKVVDRAMKQLEDENEKVSIKDAINAARILIEKNKAQDVNVTVTFEEIARLVSEVEADEY